MWSLFVGRIAICYNLMKKLFDGPDTERKIVFGPIIL